MVWPSSTMVWPWSIMVQSDLAWPWSNCGSELPSGHCLTMVSPWSNWWSVHGHFSPAWPWSTMVNHGQYVRFDHQWPWPFDHGRPWSWPSFHFTNDGQTMVRPWSYDGRPWSMTMIDHGQTMVDHGLTMILLQGWIAWKKLILYFHCCPNDIIILWYRFNASPVNLTDWLRSSEAYHCFL